MVEPTGYSETGHGKKLTRDGRSLEDSRQAVT